VIDTQSGFMKLRAVASNSSPQLRGASGHPCSKSTGRPSAGSFILDLDLEDRCLDEAHDAFMFTERL
jgi:hypothetical protein